MALGLRTPVCKTLTLANGASNVMNFARNMGTGHIQNLGPGNVFVMFDGTPAGTPQDGQFTLLPGQPYNINSINFITIGFWASGGPVRVEVVTYIEAEVQNQG